jgi:hypothetical protein
MHALAFDMNVRVWNENPSINSFHLYIYQYFRIAWLSSCQYLIVFVCNLGSSQWHLFTPNNEKIFNTITIDNT